MWHDKKNLISTVDENILKNKILLADSFMFGFMDIIWATVYTWIYIEIYKCCLENWVNCWGLAKGFFLIKVHFR